MERTNEMLEGLQEKKEYEAMKKYNNRVMTQSNEVVDYESSEIIEGVEKKRNEVMNKWIA